MFPSLQKTVIIFVILSVLQHLCSPYFWTRHAMFWLVGSHRPEQAPQPYRDDNKLWIDRFDIFTIYMTPSFIIKKYINIWLSTT